MKITFVIHSLSSLGGAEKILVILANHFVTIGHNINIILLSDSNTFFTLNDEIKLFYMKKIKYSYYLPKKIQHLTSQVEYIVNTSKKINPDIIVGFIASTNILTILGAKLSSVPVIIAEHNSYHHSLSEGRNKIETAIWQFLRRITYPLCNHLIVLTEVDKPKYHYVKDITVIRNPLVLQNKHSNIQKENIILGVGRLNHIKGFDMLIDAFSMLPNNSWRLIIAGEGSERTSLQKLINQLNLKNKVSLLGQVDDIEYLYKQASIFVLSSHSEGFPGALCEAMGYGCCSIAFDCPTGPKEIITHNQDGVLVEANNTLLLSQTINQLINDEKRRELLGNEAQKINEKLNIKNISEKWETILIDTHKN